MQGVTCPLQPPERTVELGRLRDRVEQRAFDGVQQRALASVDRGLGVHFASPSGEDYGRRSGRCQTVRCAIVAGGLVRPAEEKGLSAAQGEAPTSTAEVTGWLAEHGRRALAVERLAGDVSTRRYFRVRLRGEDRTRIVAVYPAELAAAQRRFSRAAALLAAAGVRVPAIELDDAERGFALLEDLGPRTLYEAHRGWESCPAELCSALDAATAIASLPAVEVAALGSPPLDAELLRRELETTQRVFFAPRGLDGRELAAAFDELCARLGRAPCVACHRDLMARNLVPLGDGAVAVLDFQDLRLGPAAYDFAALLNDSFFAAAETERAVLAERGPAGSDRHDYRRAVVQRGLKAVGTFVAFA